VKRFSGKFSDHFAFKANADKKKRQNKLSIIHCNLLWFKHNTLLGNYWSFSS